MTTAASDPVQSPDQEVARLDVLVPASLGCPDALDERTQLSMYTSVSPDLTLHDLHEWAGMQAERLRQGLDANAASYPAFVLSQAAKLAEEVGELQAEVLGHAGYQRGSKGVDFTVDTMAGELADVLICTAILANSHGVDLGKAVAAKIEKIEARHRHSRLV